MMWAWKVIRSTMGMKSMPESLRSIVLGSRTLAFEATYCTSDV